MFCTSNTNMAFNVCAGMHLTHHSVYSTLIQVARVTRAQTLNVKNSK